jgi:hypothetical protein
MIEEIGIRRRDPSIISTMSLSTWLSNLFPILSFSISFSRLYITLTFTDSVVKADGR